MLTDAVWPVLTCRWLSCIHYFYRCGSLRAGNLSVIFHFAGSSVSDASLCGQINVPSLFFPLIWSGLHKSWHRRLNGLLWPDPVQILQKRHSIKSLRAPACPSTSSLTRAASRLRSDLFPAKMTARAHIHVSPWITAMVWNRYKHISVVLTFSCRLHKQHTVWRQTLLGGIPAVLPQQSGIAGVNYVK